MERLLAAEWERFTPTTAASGAHNVRASETLPLGVTSSFQHWEPYPISIQSATGAWLTDVDGRQLLDLSMGFGAMLVGHLNPVVVEHVTRALDRDRHPVRHPVAAGDRDERAVPRPVRRGHAALHQLRHRVADVRHPRGPRIHRPQGRGEDRGRLPRWVRRAPGLGQAGAGGHRPGRRPDRRRPLRRRGRHRPRGGLQQPADARERPRRARLRRRGDGHRAGDREPLDRRCPTRATSRGSVRCATSTASCCSSTR